MFGWLRRRREYRALVEKDAADLIARLGKEQAYAETAFRACRQPDILDGNRPPGHWTHVRAVIAKKLEVTTGLTGWDRAG